MKRVAAIILAAGGSSRMGSAKQLLPWRGRSLLAHAVETALGSMCRPVLVVVGSQAQRMRQEIAKYPVEIVENAEWAEGMGSSIRRGVESLEAISPEADGVILMLCDQPLVSSALLDRLVQTYEVTGKGIVACEYGGSVGVPALFDRALFAELAGLRGAAGAKGIILAHRADVAMIPFPEGTLDLDRPEDLDRLRLPR